MFTDTLSNKDTYNERRKKGVESLLYFYNQFQEPGFPIIVDKEFEINITKNLKLVGDFHFIRKKDGIVETIIFKTDENINQKVSLLYDLEINATNIAIDKYLNAANKRIIVYNLDKKKKNIVNLKKINVSSFINTVKNIYKAIHNKLFYIVPSERCISCVYKDICEKDM